MNTSTLNIRIDVDDKGSIQIKKLGSELTDAGDKGKKAASGMDQAFGSLRNTIGAIALGALGKQVIDVMDTYTQLESRLKLVTTSSENLNTVQKSLYDISLRTHISQKDTIDLYTRMARATEALGFSQASTLQVTETINQALIVSGSSATESAAALQQLSQGLGSGVLRGEEFNSVMEQTPRLAKAMADGLGVNIGQLREMANTGQLTSEVVTRALLSQKEAIQREFSQMKTTIGQAWTDLGTVIQTYVHEADKASDSTGGIVKGIQDLTAQVEQNKTAILGLFTGIMQGSAMAVEGVGNIIRSVQGLAIVAASSDKTIFDWLSASKEEMKAWQQEVGNGTAFIKDQIADLIAKRNEVSSSWHITAEGEAAMRREVATINEQIAALELQQEVTENLAAVIKTGYVDSWQKAGQAAKESLTTTEQGLTRVKDAWEVYGTLQKNNAKEISAAEDKIYKEKTEREEKAAKEKEDSLKKQAEAHKKHVEEIAQLEAKLTDELNKATLSRYDYSIQKLADEIAEMRKMEGASKATQDKITAYYKVKLDEARRFGNMYSADEQKRLEGMKDTFVALEDIKTAKFAEDTTKQTALREEMAVFFENTGNTQLANELARLEAKYQAKLKEAGDDKALQTEVAEWHRLNEEEIVRKDQERSLAAKLQERDTVANHLHELTLANQEHFIELTALEEAWAETSKTIKTELGKAFVEEFGGIEGAWGALWDSMLMKMGDVVAEMAINWSVSAIGNMFEGWDIYHAGIWSLKDDEVPSILQKGEMVIPAWVAEDIRSNMGNNGPDNWGGLLDATENYDAYGWGEENNGAVAASMGGKIQGQSIAGIIGALTGQVDINDVVSGVVSPQNMVGIMGSSLVDTAVSAYSPEPSAYGSFGSAAGKGLTMIGLAGLGLPGMAIGAIGALGGLLGSWVGDLLGDALNDRSFESIRDMVENGSLTHEQAAFMQKELASTGFESAGTLGGFADAIGGMIGDIADAIGDMFDGFMDDDGEDGEESNEGDVGFGEGDPDPSNWARGGIVNRLIIPRGDDGWGALKLGEGVLDADTMKILSASIRNGQFGGATVSSTDVKDALDTLNSALFTIAKHTQATAKMLTKFDREGLGARA